MAQEIGVKRCKCIQNLKNQMCCVLGNVSICLFSDKWTIRCFTGDLMLFGESVIAKKSSFLKKKKRPSIKMDVSF